MSTKSKQVAYSCNMQAVDALKEDGAICNFYRKSYDEEATAAGGIGNRKVFKIINDEINEYQDIYKILTGEQRARITEDIPVINFYDSNNTGFAFHYNRDEEGHINSKEITALNLSRDETEPERSLEYIEREDPYIINRALLGEKSSMGQQFWGTSGQQMSDFNLQTTYRVKQGGIKYIYNGIFPKDFVTYVIGDYTSGKEYRPDEIYIFKTSKASASLSITLADGGVRRQESILYTDDSNFSVGVFLPAAPYRDDPARFLILSCTAGTWALDFAEEISSYTSSVEFPIKLQPGSTLPSYLIGGAPLLAAYLNIERQSLSEAPGLLNGLYTKPNSFDQYNSATVADWLLNDDRAVAQKTGVDLALGTKYYPGHILHRGLVLSSPFKTTNEEEAGFPGKLSYITNLLSNSNAETFFDPVEVSNWSSFTARKIKVSNKDSWGSDFRFQKAEGEYISYSDIESLIQGFKNLLVIKSGKTYLELVEDADYPIFSFKDSWKSLTNKNFTENYGSADDMKTKWNKFAWAEIYKDVNWGIISDSQTELQKLIVKNVVDAFGGSTDTPVLIWPEDNDHFPREVYLFSKVDLQLNTYSRTNPSRALCSFYSNVDGVKRVLCFKVSKADYVNFGAAEALKCGDNYYTSDDLNSKLSSMSFYVYSLEAYGADTSEVTYYDRNGVAQHFVSNAAIPALAYPTDYFAVEPGTAKNQIFEYHDPARTEEFLKYLNGSVIVPGLPIVNDYRDFSNFRKTDCTPTIDCQIFEDMVRDNKAIARASFSSIESVINEWPLTKGANPLIFSQLQDFLHSLLALNDRLSEFVRVIPALENSNFDLFRERLWRDTTTKSTLAEFLLPANLSDSYLGASFPATLNNCCQHCSLTVKESESYIRKSISYLSEVVDTYLANPTVANARLVDQCLGNNTLAFLRFDSTGTAEEGINDYDDEVALVFNDMQEGARSIIDWASTAFFTRELNNEVYGTDLYGNIITPEKFAGFKAEWDKLVEQSGNVDMLTSNFKAYFRETESRQVPDGVRKLLNNSFTSTALLGTFDLAGHNGVPSSWYGWFAETINDPDWEGVGTTTRMLEYASGQKAFGTGTKADALKKAFQAALDSANNKLAEKATPDIVNQRFIDFTVQQLGGGEVTTRDEAIEYVVSKICSMDQASDGTYSLAIGTKTITGLHPIALDEEADLKMADLLAIVSYIKAKLVGETDSKTGLEVNGVEYLPNGTLSGDENSLYYKRYLILNDRLNKCNGTLAKAANFINNSGVYESVNTFNEGKIASYKDYLEAEKVAEMREMYFMPAAINNANEPIFGKFYDKEMLDNVKSYLSQNCVLTCTKCSVAESCPFYDINGLLDRWVPEKTTIDLKLKDNELDLLYYGDLSPWISREYTVLGHKIKLPLGSASYKDMHKPYIDIIRSTSGTSSKVYDGIDFQEVVDEMNVVDLQDNLTEDNSGRIISGRYGTIQINEAAQSQNVLDTLESEEILHYKYLYDAVYISDAEEYEITDSDSAQEVIEKTKHNDARTCFNYRPSAYEYPVELDMNGYHYSGTTKIKVPSGLKLLDKANDWDDVYLASDDTINDSKPLIYLGLNCNVKNLLMFDLTDTNPNEEVSLYRDDSGKLCSTANTLYAKDVAQWSVNILKGRMDKNPLGSNPNNLLENRDQYWMETIQKPVTFEGKTQYVACPGRPRVRTGFTEMITDGQDITKGSLISGKPFANTYVDFVREVKIIFKNVNEDGTSTELIPWVKGSTDPYEIQARREALPKMKTNLRLVVVKNDKPEGWDGTAEIQVPAPVKKLQKAKVMAANPNIAAATWLSQAMSTTSNSPLPTPTSQDVDAILAADLNNLKTQIAEAEQRKQEIEEALAETTPGGKAADVVATVAQAVGNAAVAAAKAAVNNIIVEPVKEAVDWVEDKVDTAVTWVEDTATNIWNGACDVVETVGDAIADGANWVADRAEEVWDGVTDVAETAWNGVCDAANAVGNAVADGAEKVGNFFKKLKFW